MICPTCNTTLREQARFCRNCGSAIEVYDDGGFEPPHSGASAEGDGESSYAWWQKVNSIILPLESEPSLATSSAVEPGPEPPPPISQSAPEDPGPRYTRLLDSSGNPSPPRRPASPPDASSRYTRPISSVTPGELQEATGSKETVSQSPPVSSRPDLPSPPQNNQSNLRSTRQIPRPENLPRSLTSETPPEGKETLPEYRAPSTFLKDRLRAQSPEGRQTPPPAPPEPKPAESPQRQAVEPPVEPWPLPKARPREAPSAPAMHPPVEPWPLPKPRPPQKAEPPQPAKPAPLPAIESQPENHSKPAAPSIFEKIAKEKSEQVRPSQPLKNPAPQPTKPSERRPDLRPQSRLKAEAKPDVRPAAKPEAPAVATSWTRESREPNSLPLATLMLLAVGLIFSLAFFWLR